MRRRKSRGVCVLLRRGGLAALLFWNQLGSATSDSAARQAGPFGLKTATRGGSSGSHGAQDSVLRSISKGEAVTYPDPEYTEGANEAFAPSGRDGMKMKSKSCVHCMMFNSKQKVAKKYSDIMKDAMGGSMRDARADAIGKQMTRQDTASMRDRTGDSSYGNGADSDIDRRRKDAAEKKCLDEPVAKQPACLRKAKAMEPEPIVDDDDGPPTMRSTNPHSIDEPPPPNSGPPFEAFVETMSTSLSQHQQLPDTHANEFLVNPSLGNGTIWDQSKVRSYTDPVEAANPMGPGDDGLALLLQTVVCGNEESPQLLTALYQAVVGDDLVVQCELMVY